MKKTPGESRPDEGTDPADFIRDNELAEEIDQKPVITTKGEQLLDELRGDSSE
jgi:hypothetical protein